MPLSKARDKERKRLERSVQPNSNPPTWIVQPNPYLAAHLRVCPDYDPVQPNNHFEHCPYVNPSLRPREPLPNCPDGRYRAGW